MAVIQHIQTQVVGITVIMTIVGITTTIAIAVAMLAPSP